MKHPISRRTLLRGAGGLAVALPFFDTFVAGRRALAADTIPAGTFPKRFVAFWTPNGTHPSNWFPTGSGTQYTMSPYLTPLQAHQDKLLILKGINMPAAVAGAGDDHERGIGACLTGTETVSTTGRPLAGGISLDQTIANHIGNATKFRSLELGVQSYYNGDTIYERISYRGANQALPPERDPLAAYKRIFADFDPSPESDRRLVGRRSVLDFVGADHQRLMSQLGARDRAKLDAHLTAIREVEGRLGVGAPTGASCTKPEVGSPFDFSAPANFPKVGRLQMDMLAMALACDLTRVGSLMWSFGRSKHVFKWLDPTITEEHHELSHERNPDSGDSFSATAVKKVQAINVFYAGQLAYLMERLKAIPEGEGTVLDNTIILWCNELGEGRGHTHENVPLIVAGGGGGALRPGRLLSYDGRSTNDLYVALLNAMGLPDTTFGNPKYNQGALSNLG